MESGRDKAGVTQAEDQGAPDSGSVSPLTPMPLASQPPRSILMSVGTCPGKSVCTRSRWAIRDSKEKGRIAPLSSYPLKSTREN